MSVAICRVEQLIGCRQISVEKLPEPLAVGGREMRPDVERLSPAPDPKDRAVVMGVGGEFDPIDSVADRVASARSEDAAFDLDKPLADPKPLAFSALQQPKEGTRHEQVEQRRGGPQNEPGPVEKCGTHRPDQQRESCVGSDESRRVVAKTQDDFVAPPLDVDVARLWEFGKHGWRS